MMFACLYVPPLVGRPASGPPRPLQPALWSDASAAPWDADRTAHGDLASLAREFSPRVEVHHPGLVPLDARGLERLFGDAASLGDQLRRAAADRRLPVRIALASTRTAAWLIAHTRAGLTIVPAGDERRSLSPLSLHVLEQLAANGLGPAVAHVHPVDAGGQAAAPRTGSAQRESAAAVLNVLARWGLKTLGEFAALPSVAVSERLGQQGLAWQHVARGEEMVPLVPDAPDERFEETVELEWPIEGLQPLSFVFGRLFDALSAHLCARDRAAAVLHIHLQLVTREVERRSLQLPAPMRDARVLRTLALLNLEAHPVTAGIDRVTVIADPVPGRVTQCSLLTRAVPFPEQLSTLLARLSAVAGERRVGTAALVDSHRPGAFEMNPFNVSMAHGIGQRAAGIRNRESGIGNQGSGTAASPHPASRTPNPVPSCVIRRFRVPVSVSVVVKDGRPQRVALERAGWRGGLVSACAGPWRTCGEWWCVADARVESDGDASRPLVGWNRDEWDVNLADGAVYRIYRDRDRDRWFVDGVVD
jgi:protein ImuB